MVAKPVHPSAPAIVIFIMCTDSKYNHNIILQRWRYVEGELKKRGIGVISNGADGAGPFLKAMTTQTSLFRRSLEKNVPSYWTFYLMPKLYESGLSSQDVVHLLAKLRTRLLTPSNVVIMGIETACRAVLMQGPPSTAAEAFCQVKTWSDATNSG